MRKDIESLKDSREDVQLEKRSDQGNQKELQNQIDSLKIEIAEKDEALSASKGEAVRLKDQIAKIQSTTEARLSTCMQEGQSERREKAKVQKQLGQISSENEELKEQLKDAAEKTIQADNQIEELKAQMKSMELNVQYAWVPQWLEMQLNKTSEWAAQQWRIANSHPTVNLVTSVGLEYANLAWIQAKESGSIAARRLSDAKTALEPFIADLTRQGVELYKVALDRFMDAYAIIKPKLLAALEISQVKAREFYVIACNKFEEVLQSQAASKIKQQGLLTIQELRQFITYQMQQQPALMPYSTQQNIDLIIYGLLALPLPVLLMLMRCCSGTGKRKNAAVPAPPIETEPEIPHQGPKESTGKGTKGKKSKKKGSGHSLTVGQETVSHP